MGTLIDGKAMAGRVTEQVTRAVAAIMGTAERPGLAVVLVGEDPASQVYVRSKRRTAEACGFLSLHYEFPATTSEADLLGAVAELNADPRVDGILVQMPLPKHIDSGRVIEAIDPAKDVDGFHPINVGLLATGQVGRALVPCTPAGAMLLLRATVSDGLSGKRAIVLGRSTIVGRPMAQLLLQADCTVTIGHSRTRDLPALTREADIVVAAVGKPQMVGADWLKPGAVVVDVGINRVPGEAGKSRLVGDVDTAAAITVAAAVTPVPGGVGPMTIALLMRNTLEAACRRRGLPLPG